MLTISRVPGVRVEMEGKRPSGFRNVVLVWVVGLTLGIGAGALTALLLLPAAEEQSMGGETLADRLNRNSTPAKAP